MAAPGVGVVPLQFRGRSLTAVALHLSGAVDAGFWAGLDARLRQTPLFFEHAPLVIDLSEAPAAARPAPTAPRDCPARAPRSGR
ncbi:hypothetical protein, partial [Escherichia coli]|uniref:hypothetical protein n=1 Tax=Escherichia coli TaxID=562 RepID=UPI0034D96FBF